MKDMATRLRENADLDAAEGGNPDVCQLERDAADLIDSMTAMMCELVLDAERYQHVRTQTWDQSQFFVVAGGKECVKLGVDCPSHERLDDLVDASIAAAAGKPAQVGRKPVYQFVDKSEPNSTMVLIDILRDGGRMCLIQFPAVSMYAQTFRRLANAGPLR